MSIKLVSEKETYKIIGACIEVHKKLGNGFSVEVYKEALTKELLKAEIPFEKQKKLAIYYDGEKLDKYHIAEIVCFNTILVEITAMNFLSSTKKYQVINLLKSTRNEIGLLINFGEDSLSYKRVVL